MRLKLIACKALSRELSYLSSLSNNNIDSTFVRQGYHENPDLLRKNLQAEIDSVESGNDPHTNALGGNGNDILPNIKEDFDAILLGYGLCSNGIVGLHAQRHPLIIPRGHDCITLFLGSKERYHEYFQSMLGCYWYTASWIENSSMPCEKTQQRQMEYYREKGFDEDDLEFFMEDMNSWTKRYHYAAYIKMPFFDKPELQDFTKEAAKFYNWEYVPIEGDMALMKRFIDGEWNEKEFLIVPPGYQVTATGDANVIACTKMPEKA